MAPKKKNEKMSLGTFLQDENYGSWADEMEDMPLPSTDSRPGYGTERRGFGSSGAGFGGDRPFERREYSQREQLPLPTSPPYTAHLANLSFDASDEDVQDFFRDCEVKEVRIVRDKMDDKPKGFGYVTFGSLEGLKTALSLSNGSLAGRAVRVSVAEPPKERLDPARDLSDWSRKGPLPDLPNQRRVSDRPTYNRFDDARSDAGSERGGRRGFEPAGDGKVRDFSNWERKGPLAPVPGQEPVQGRGTSLRDGGRQHSKNGPDFRHNSPSWGEGRSQDGSRPPRRDYDRPPAERQPTASELDNEWRSRMRPDAPAKSPTPETSNPPSPRPAAAPATRPKLNLQKRTVSEADPVTSPAATGDSKASPFGAARPIDTAARERAVEEKRQLAIRERKEAEEKARAEKAEEKRLAREKGEPEQPESPKATKQNAKGGEEEDEKHAGPKFDILRRAESGNNDMVADDENEEDPAPTTDKDVKPKEVVVPASQANGSWRKGAAGPKSPEAATTAEALEEDGWSTVSKPNKQRNNRRGGPRAIAS